MASCECCYISQKLKFCKRSRPDKDCKSRHTVPIIWFCVFSTRCIEKLLLCSLAHCQKYFVHSSLEFLWVCRCPASSLENCRSIYWAPTNPHELKRTVNETLLTMAYIRPIFQHNEWRHTKLDHWHCLTTYNLCQDPTYYRVPHFAKCISHNSEFLGQVTS